MASPMLDIPYDEYLLPEFSDTLEQPLGHVDSLISMMTAHAIHEPTMYRKPPRCIILPEDCEAVEIRPIYQNKSEHTQLGEAITFPTIPYPFVHTSPSTYPQCNSMATLSDMMYTTTLESSVSPPSSTWASDTATSFGSDLGSPFEFDLDFGSPASSPRRMAKTRANQTYGVPTYSPPSSLLPSSSPPPRTPKKTGTKRRSSVDDEDYSEEESEYESDAVSSDSDEEYTSRASSRVVSPVKSRKRQTSTSSTPKRKRAVREELEHAPLGKYECGLIVEYVSKSSRMTIKGLDAPPVGSICPMRCVNRTDLKRHQEAGWHSAYKWCCPFCGSVICNRKDACKRHVETSCKGAPKGGNVWCDLLQTQGLVFKPATKTRSRKRVKKLDDDEY
ncbi:SubName: Full=Uncharacterized protein {ECO:0000313/EMBL:CCA71520.1} [Serendipita indica DSM 11827]|nr:SubName: Full=Uncharacterized protein {ECO:0000313/EMBL:CCA71520.1} [Serendipita indica DSM 11827]